LLAKAFLPTFQRVLQLFPLFSHSCALFCTTGATQLFSNQFIAHSFHRHGGCTPSPLLMPAKSAILEGQK
jgi:hypothetical protein